jgi:dynein heavy chain
MGLPLQLINGLSDERVRWQETVENLEHMLDNISGDILLASGFVAYLGPFTVRSSHSAFDESHLQKRPFPYEGSPQGVLSSIPPSFRKHSSGPH